MNKPRILVISELDIWSMGHDRGAPSLSRTLQAYVRHGWDVTFLTSNLNPGGQDPPGVEVLRFDASRLARFQRIRGLGFFVRILFWIYFQVRAHLIARRCWRKKPFSVVYGCEIAAVPVAWCLSRAWGIPMVARHLGTVFGVEYDGRRFGWLRGWNQWLALRIPADLVIMTNDGTQGDRVLKKVGADMSKVRFWMNGADKTPYLSLPSKHEARRRLGLQGSPVIMTLSRLARWKRVDLAIGTMPEVCREFPNARLVVVGSGEESAALQDLTRKLGVARHITFAGSVPRSELKEYWGAADLFLSLYSYSNLGNPMFEAMLAGKCIVTLDNGDTSTIVHDGDNGIVLKETDLDKLPRTIIDVLKNESRCKELGDRARGYAFCHFWTWEDRMKAELDAVEHIVSGSSSRVLPKTPPRVNAA